MELQKLSYFLAIVKYDKFTTAANELFISQSSLSKQILSLERELGVKLFNRNTRNIELTTIGEQLIPCAQRIVSESERMSLLVNEFKKVHKERILIGAIPVLSYYGIMDIIAAYEKQYQNMKIEITETDTTPIFKMLNESEIDIGIIRTDELQHTCYDVMPICDDELVLLVGRRHRLADRRIVSLEETAEDEFLFFNTDSFLLKYYEKLFKHAGVSPKVQYSHMRLITIFSFIKQNKVVTLIMKRLAESYHDPMLRLVPLTNHPISSLSLVTRKNDVSQFGENFIKYLMNCKTKQAKLLKKG